MDITDGYKLLHDGVLAFNRAEKQGFRIDIDYCEDMKLKLTNRIKGLEQDFKDSDLYQKWQKHYRGKTNIGSPDQLAHVLYGIMGLVPLKHTKKGGKGSTDVEALQALNVPAVNYLLDARKLKKIRDTYLEGFLREQVDGVLHPFFNLHTVKTYRSSSDRVNFQNIPKRDKDAQRICRSAVYPRIGHQLLGVDYSGVEVRIAACLTEDKRLMHDVLHGDMHGDMAVELYMLDGLDKSHSGESVLRQGAKNGFVFPQFYGDYYVKCAPNLLTWANNVKLRSGVTAYKHLEDKELVVLDKNGNIKRMDNFVEHVRKVEDSFWNERYCTYTKWKEKTWVNYQKNGYVELPTGLKCGELMSRNEAINRPIQGGAFHCLLWSFIRVNDISKDEGWDSLPVGQIHDEMILDVYPKELEMVAKRVRKVMCEDIHDGFPWLGEVPLDIEADLGAVDASWYEQEAYKI